MWLHRVNAGLLARRSPLAHRRDAGLRRDDLVRGTSSSRRRAARDVTDAEHDERDRHPGRPLPGGDGAALERRRARESPGPPAADAARRQLPSRPGALQRRVRAVRRFRDAMFHLSDRRFAAEFLRFARQERRELTIVLRERTLRPGGICLVRRLRARASAVVLQRQRPDQEARAARHAEPLSGGESDQRHLDRRGRRGCSSGRLDGLVRPPIEDRDISPAAMPATGPTITWLERLHAWLQ